MNPKKIVLDKNEPETTPSKKEKSKPRRKWRWPLWRRRSTTPKKNDAADDITDIIILDAATTGVVDSASGSSGSGCLTALGELLLLPFKFLGAIAEAIVDLLD